MKKGPGNKTEEEEISCDENKVQSVLKMVNTTLSMRLHNVNSHNHLTIDCQLLLC